MTVCVFPISQQPNDHAGSKLKLDSHTPHTDRQTGGAGRLRQALSDRGGWKEVVVEEGGVNTVQYIHT